MTELVIALTLWGLALPFFISIGVNGIRYAYILRLAWPIYIEAVFWLLSGLMSCWGFAVTVISLRSDQIPPGLEHLGFREWIGLIIGVLFIGFLAFGKYAVIRHTRATTLVERAAVAEMYKEMYRVRRIRGAAKNV